METGISREAKKRTTSSDGLSDAGDASKAAEKRLRSNDGRPSPKKGASSDGRRTPDEGSLPAFSPRLRLKDHFETMRLEGEMISSSPSSAASAIQYAYVVATEGENIFVTPKERPAGAFRPIGVLPTGLVLSKVGLLSGSTWVVGDHDIAVQCGQVQGRIRLKIVRSLCTPDSSDTLTTRWTANADQVNEGNQQIDRGLTVAALEAMREETAEAKAANANFMMTACIRSWHGEIERSKEIQHMERQLLLTAQAADAATQSFEEFREHAAGARQRQERHMEELRQDLRRWRIAFFIVFIAFCIFFIVVIVFVAFQAVPTVIHEKPKSPYDHMARFGTDTLAKPLMEASGIKLEAELPSEAKPQGKSKAVKDRSTWQTEAQALLCPVENGPCRWRA